MNNNTIYGATQRLWAIFVYVSVLATIQTIPTKLWKLRKTGSTGEAPGMQGQDDAWGAPELLGTHFQKRIFGIEKEPAIHETCYRVTCSADGMFLLNVPSKNHKSSSQAKTSAHRTSRSLCSPGALF